MDNPSTITDAYRAARIELAAACRYAAMSGLQSGVCNHFSAVAPGFPHHMLVNPEGLFWSEVTVSSLVLVRLDDPPTAGDRSVELTAFNIHAPVHQALPNAVAVLHTHMPYASAICARKNGVVRPVHLGANSQYRRIAYDRAFAGTALYPSEGARLASLLEDNLILMMQNHGPLVIGASIGEALFRLLCLEETCRIQILAEAGGHALQDIPFNQWQEADAESPMRKSYARSLMAAIVRRFSNEQPDFLG